MINFSSIVGFEWDIGNSQKSAQKHDVHPTEAEEVFFNKTLKEIPFLQVGDEFRKVFISIASTAQDC